MNEPTAELAALDAATSRFKRLDKQRDDARDQVIEKVVSALRAGALPTEVADRSPFTTAHVRSIARRHGVPPARPGIKPRPAAD